MGPPIFADKNNIKAWVLIGDFQGAFHIPSRVSFLIVILEMGIIHHSEGRLPFLRAVA